MSFNEQLAEQIKGVMEDILHKEDMIAGYEQDCKLAKEELAELRAMHTKLVQKQRSLPPSAPRPSFQESIAIALHDNLCQHNHADACGWMYEMPTDKIHNWNGSTHQFWLKKADKFQNYCEKEYLDIGTAIAAIKFAKLGS